MLGHPVRIRVLELLQNGPVPVRALLNEIEIEPSNLSQQLAVLRRSGIVVSIREGSTVSYALMRRRRGRTPARRTAHPHLTDRRTERAARRTPAHRRLRANGSARTVTVRPAPAHKNPPPGMPGCSCVRSPGSAPVRRHRGAAWARRRPAYLTDPRYPHPGAEQRWAVGGGANRGRVANRAGSTLVPARRRQHVMPEPKPSSLAGGAPTRGWWSAPWRRVVRRRVTSPTGVAARSRPNGTPTSGVGSQYL